MIETFLELIYPNTCIICGKNSSRGICVTCEKNARVIQEPRCMCCGKPIHSYEEEYCEDCLAGKKVFHQGRSIWVHKGNVKQSVYKFKYKNHRIFAKEYARIIVEQYLDIISQWRPEAIVPVPVHGHRRRSRGYNQAEVLAKAIQREIHHVVGVKIPIVANVYRNRETALQKKLDNKQRRKNLKGAFRIEGGIEFPERVVIIDDIYTTGATIQEISKLLMQRGVAEVYFITISIGQGF